MAIDELVEAWTERLSSREVMETLQRAGVEAARVQTARDIVEDDEHLRARAYFETYRHLLGEQMTIEGVAFKMSETAAHVRHPGPLYGVDNDYVFAELAGLSADEIIALREDGVLA